MIFITKSKNIASQTYLFYLIWISSMIYWRLLLLLHFHCAVQKYTANIFVLLVWFLCVVSLVSLCFPFDLVRFFLIDILLVTKNVLRLTIASHISLLNTDNSKKSIENVSIQLHQFIWLHQIITRAWDWSVIVYNLLSSRSNLWE